MKYVGIDMKYCVVIELKYCVVIEMLYVLSLKYCVCEMIQRKRRLLRGGMYVI